MAFKSLPDHIPGPMEEAAVRTYYERGSGSAIIGGYWKLGALGMGALCLILSTALLVLLMLQEVHVMQVSKDASGELHVTGVASKFVADEDTQMAWASRFAGELTEITPAIWQRNVESIQGKAVGVASDQVKSYLQHSDNNPAQMLSRYPLFVREYRRVSVNKVADMTYLIRYELTSRPGPNIAPIPKRYAMTITLTAIGHKTRDDVFRNREGLAALNFSISEDIK